MMHRIIGGLIALIGLLVVAALVLSAPKAKAEPAAKTPIDLLIEARKVFWPHEVQEVSPATLPAPRLRTKRGFKKAPPPVADTPQPEVAPRVTPAPPRAKVKPKPKPRAAGISARDCARLRAAYARYGDLINMGGQGYSPADVAWARRQCRV